MLKEASGANYFDERATKVTDVIKDAKDKKETFKRNLINIEARLQHLS